jgi:hypothetical protein
VLVLCCFVGELFHARFPDCNRAVILSGAPLGAQSKDPGDSISTDGVWGFLAKQADVFVARKPKSSWVETTSPGSFDCAPNGAPLRMTARSRMAGPNPSI